MNHKLDELWKSSGGNYDRGDQHRYPQYTIKNHREYAKLIVEECIDICGSYYSVEGIAQNIVKDIKENFGIEDE